MSLKDLTHAHHRAAETQPFIKVLFSCSIEPDLYAKYLINQHIMYQSLETAAMAHGLFDGMLSIQRASAINTDFNELWNKPGNPEICPIVGKYCDYITTIQHDADKLMAHIYVRHMGDLFGGQSLANKVPGSGTFYKFNDVELLKTIVRTKIDDSMADEAKRCFEFATQFFKEMMV
jgi:heme oxygenase